MTRAWPLFFVLLALAAPTAAGLVTARAPVVVYDGPSESGTPRFLLGKGYPVVVISETSEWLTVCMHDGTSGHLRRRDTRPGNNVVVLNSERMRQSPNLGSAAVLNLGRDLLLANTGDVISGFLPVRHESGSSGFVPINSVWGHSGC